MKRWCAVKDNKWPWVRLSCYHWCWSLPGLAVETQYISCNFTQGLILTKNTTKTKARDGGEKEKKEKQAHFQEECGHNHNKQVGLIPLKHLWELQPSNKNTQALKSALHRSRDPNPQRANQGRKIQHLFAVRCSYRCPGPRRVLGETKEFNFPFSSAKRRGGSLYSWTNSSCRI